MIEWLAGTFSNRELAAGFWILVVIGYLLVKQVDIRKSFIEVLKSLFNRQLLFIALIFILNTIAVCYILSRLSLWDHSLLKASIFWVLFSGFGLIGVAVQSKERSSFNSGVFKGLLTITVAFEYVIIFKSFPLFAELILVPILVVVSTMFFMAQNDERFSVSTPVFGFILGVIGLTALWHSVSDIYYNPALFFSIDTLRDFFLPIFLTIGCIPTLFCLFLHSNFQQFNIRMNHKTYHSDDLRKFAKRRFMLAFGFSPKLLHRASRQFNTLPIENKEDVESIITEIREFEHLRKKPKPIDPRLGWNPFLAERFLKKYKLVTGDYHRSNCSEYNEIEYFAQSENRELGESVISDTVFFVIEGTKLECKVLKLIARIRLDQENTQIAFDHYHKIIENLYLLATSTEIDAKHLEMIEDNADFEEQIHHLKISHSIDLNCDNFHSYCKFVLSI